MFSRSIAAAAQESVVKQKQFWKETVTQNMELLKKANVEFFYPNKTEFSSKSLPLLEQMMKDPKMKSTIEKIKSK